MKGDDIITLTKDNIRAVNELTEDEAYFVLFALMTQNTTKSVSAMWKEFVNEIKYNRRFFPKSLLLKRIEVLKDYATTELKEGELLYRDRLFHEPFLEYDNNKEEKKALFEILNENNPEPSVVNMFDLYRVMELDPISLVYSDEKNGVIGKLRKILANKKRWWGYNAKDSDAPPNQYASAGRANSNLISYLYAANDVKTAIYEVRPLIGQEISVATIRLDKTLKVYDLYKFGNNFNNIYEGINELEELEDVMILQKISAVFSEINYKSKDEYLPTQYLCDFIRNLGFDGIRFKSSLNRDGYVIVLFETNNHDHIKNYEILESKVFAVGDYNIHYSQIAPLEI